MNDEASRRRARASLRIPPPPPISPRERLARAGASPTRSGPEGSSRNEIRLGRCPASHLSCHRSLILQKALADGVMLHTLPQAGAQAAWNTGRTSAANEHFRSESAFDDLERAASKRSTDAGIPRSGRSTFSSRVRLLAPGRLEDDEAEAHIGFAESALRRVGRAPNGSWPQLLWILAEVLIEACGCSMNSGVRKQLRNRPPGRTWSIQAGSPRNAEPLHDALSGSHAAAGRQGERRASCILSGLGTQDDQHEGVSFSKGSWRLRKQVDGKRVEKYFPTLDQAKGYLAKASGEAPNLQMGGGLLG